MVIFLVKCVVKMIRIKHYKNYEKYV